MHWEANAVAALGGKFTELSKQENTQSPEALQALRGVEILLSQLERVWIEDKDGVEQTIRNLFQKYHGVITPGIEIIMIKLLEKLAREKKEELA